VGADETAREKIQSRLSTGHRFSSTAVVIGGAGRGYLGAAGEFLGAGPSGPSGARLAHAANRLRGNDSGSRCVIGACGDGQDRDEGNVDLDEQRLIRDARGGSPDAAEALVSRYWARAYRIAWLILQDVQRAEDAAQEAVLAALRSLDQFDSERPFAPWLGRIAANKAYDLARKEARGPELAADTTRIDDLASDRAADELAVGSLPEELVAGLARLSTDQRVVLVLRHIFDYSPAEIAEELGIPASTVRTRLHRGLTRLRKELSAKEEATGEQAR
jgi:RNA polymerase sigma-70 factor (ECF subfamily)